MSRELSFHKILLHICCGPCAMWPLRSLLDSGADVTLFFYNPNIHPEMEWKRRFENAERVAGHYNLRMIVEPDNNSSAWRDREDDGDQRCRFCYETRLERTAREAAANGYDAVSTTLLVSPYQNRELLLAAGKAAADANDVSFVPFDWRDGFRKGQEMARELGLYRQKYCGCVVSLEHSDYFETVSREHEQLALAACLGCGGDLLRG
ncbi:MAG TPA: epoxyqueuosine reductase QueH [Bacillota bacterium]|nr:epoxyqueuosine reductase QueH [Bacillota bacterium]